MATIAIGDIHGFLAPLSTLLSHILEVATADDTVVFLGDYIDRGPESCQCLDAIVSFTKETRATVVGLLGNHEEWLLQTHEDYTRHSWLIGMEGLSTIRSYSPEAEEALRAAARDAGVQLYIGKCALPYHAFFDVMPSSHHAFFAQLAPAYESADCICTHAGLDPGIANLTAQPRDAVVWGHSAFPLEYDGPKPVVYGHWDNAVRGPDGWPMPRVIGNTIGVDTISHGVLSAVRFPDRTVFQSNGAEVRTQVL
jgi:diadenosine tetraphosphatase ApaH/serine/threonine PP2A family protein phosphatase